MTHRSRWRGVTWDRDKKAHTDLNCVWTWKDTHQFPFYQIAKIDGFGNRKSMFKHKKIHINLPFTRSRKPKDGEIVKVENLVSLENVDKPFRGRVHPDVSIIMKSACSAVVWSDYSASFRCDDFFSFLKEFDKFKINMLQLIVHTYKRSLTLALLRHNLLLIVLQVNQSKIQSLIILTGIHANRRPRVVRDAMHSGKSGAVHSG